MASCIESQNMDLIFLGEDSLVECAALFFFKNRVIQPVLEFFDEIFLNGRFGAFHLKRKTVLAWSTGNYAMALLKMFILMSICEQFIWMT